MASYKRIIQRLNKKSADDPTTLKVVTNNILDKLFVSAAPEFDEEACKLLSTYVAFLRVMYLVHQKNHWDALRYGDHLLFQRIYEDVGTLADDAAERVIGLCGKLADVPMDGFIKEFSHKEDTLTSTLESSLSIEKAFLDLNKKTYEALKEKNMMTLGLDDMIMAQASESEVHVYLLQQALKGTDIRSS